MVRKENFLKLKQSDRIEYLLRLKGIEDRNEGNSYINTIWLMFATVGFLMLAFLGVANLKGIESALPLLESLPLVFTAFGVLIVFGIFYDAFRMIAFYKEIKELDSEFFKVEIKTKK